MSQLGFRYRPAHEGHEIWLQQLETLRAAVAHLEPKNVLFELDISKSTLSEALNEKNDKRWAAEWTHIVKSMLSQRYDELSRELLGKLCEFDIAVTPFVVSEPHALTPEQERDAYRAELARTEEGRAAIDRVRKLSKGKGKR
jgi:hypothetical protein